MGQGRIDVSICRSKIVVMVDVREKCICIYYGWLRGVVDSPACNNNFLFSDPSEATPMMNAVTFMTDRINCTNSCPQRLSEPKDSSTMMTL